MSVNTGSPRNATIEKMSPLFGLTPWFSKRGAIVIIKQTMPAANAFAAPSKPFMYLVNAALGNRGQNTYENP